MSVIKRFREMAFSIDVDKCGSCAIPINNRWRHNSVVLTPPVMLSKKMKPRSAGTCSTGREDHQKIRSPTVPP